MQLRSAWKEPPSLVSLGLIILIASCFCTPFTDLDFTWQIRTGEQIVRSGQLRTVDEFSYTIAGEPVHDFEWLYEVMLYLVWSALGVGGLKLLKVILIVIPLLLLGLHLRRQQVSRGAVLLALLLAVVILIPFWNLRALSCTTIGSLLVTTALHDHCAGRRPLSWWLPVVMLLWANLHPGVIAGQGLLLGALAWEWANRWLKLNPPLDRAGLQRLTLIGMPGLLATFISPDPFDRLLYPFRPELRHPIMRVFVEMQPLWTFVDQAPFVVLPVYLIAALVLISVLVRFREYRLWEVVLLLVLALLANTAIRSLQDWLFVMLALGVPQLAALEREVLARPGRWHNFLSGLDSAAQQVFAGAMFRFQPLWLCLCLAVMPAIALSQTDSEELPFADICGCPDQAVAYIQREGLHGRFFAPPNYGSYLGWSLGPKATVYVDTRGFFFPPQLLEDSHVLPQLGPGWQKSLDRVLNQYPTDYLLLETTGPRGKLWQHLHAKNVQPLYQDGQTALLSASQVRDSLPVGTASVSH